MDSDEHARSTCGVPDLRQQLVRRRVWNGRWLAADVDGLLVPIDRRRFGAAPAMMVPRRRGATNTTLAATQRHSCRSGMVTADCAWSRSRPESVVASGALKDQRKIPAFTISVTTRAREALMMAGAGGAMRATGWRATAIRFQQFGEGGSYGIAR